MGRGPLVATEYVNLAITFLSDSGKLFWMDGLFMDDGWMIIDDGGFR